MLKQYAVPLPKPVRGENAFIYPLNVSAFDAHRIRRGNGATASTYWRSPYHGPDTNTLDIQFKNTEIYNTTIRKQLEAKDKSVKSILKNSLLPSSSEKSVSERSKTPEGRKPKYNLRVPSPNQSRQSGKKGKRVKFDDRYGRLSNLESKYRMLQNKRKANAEVCSDSITINDSEKVTVNEPACRFHSDTNSEPTKQDKNQEHTVCEQQSVFYLQETEGCTENPENEEKLPEFEPITEKLGSVHITDDNEETEFPKNGGEVLSFEETADVLCEQIPLLCDVNLGEHLDTSLFQKTNKSPISNVTTRDATGKRSKSLVKSKTAPNLLMTRYAHSSNDVRSRRASFDSYPLASKVALGRRRISGKTTVNTLGGAVVTRSHVRPVMFSRLSRESSHVHAIAESSQSSYKNFCDKSKTNQIVNWLEHVKQIQSREGPCIQADSDIDDNQCDTL
ncbi:uncharacterized protein [Argopecten irradians]|uniref:uncharacterized protein n=1 Tax=Argopecten irradians TaxID=31199 RepID=UPI0037134FEC